MELTYLLVLTAALQAPTGTPALFTHRTFTCADFAHAVNHFVEIGEEQACRELEALNSDGATDIKREYRTKERAGWMCRVLFEPKASQPIRQPWFGRLALPEAAVDLKRFPLFPVARSGSTYFVLREGYSLGGAPEHLDSYINYCRQIGHFRKAPIPVPSEKVAPRDARALHASRAWQSLPWYKGGKRYENESWEFIQKQADGIPPSPDGR